MATDTIFLSFERWSSGLIALIHIARYLRCNAIGPITKDQNDALITVVDAEYRLNMNQGGGTKYYTFPTSDETIGKMWL